LHATLLGVLYKVLERNADHMRSLWHAVRHLREPFKVEGYEEIASFFVEKLRVLEKCYSEVLEETVAVSGTGDSDVNGSSLKRTLEICDQLRSEIGETQSEFLTARFGEKFEGLSSPLSKGKMPDLVTAWLDLQYLSRNLRTITTSLQVLAKSPE